jgi:hypothetical protein
MNTCRFCKGVSFRNDLMQYGARHYAHHACYLMAGKPLSALSTWKIETFPYFLLKEHELLDEAKRIIMERTAARDRLKAALA